MTCERSGELMVDVLYGEEVHPRDSFRFFQHLNGCADCRNDYFELTETREALSAWTPEEDLQPSQGTLPQKFSWPLRGGVSWWLWMQRIAAGILIVFGAFSLVRSLGFWQPPAPDISEERMTEMVHDLVVERQTEDWKLIGRALLSLKEEMENQNRAEREVLYEDLQALEKRFIQVMDENSRQVRTLLSQ